MGVFQTIGKLRGFLTPKNLELLDVIFEGLTTPNEKAFNYFWGWFASKKDWDSVEYAIGTLAELRKILNEYRGVQK